MRTRTPASLRSSFSWNRLAPLTLAACCLALAAASCPGSDSGSDTTDTSNEPVHTAVDPTTSTGSVGGAVVNLADGTALSGVSVALHAGGTVIAPATTDANGQFSFASVPAGGTAHVVMTKASYYSAEVDVTLTNAAGNFPTANSHAFVGPVAMLAYGTKALTVSTMLTNGQPAEGARVLLDLPIRFAELDGDALLNPRGSIHKEATTGADGKAAFAELPDLPGLATRFPDLEVTVTVAALTDAAGQATTQGQSRAIKLLDLTLGTDRLNFLLQPFVASDTLRVVASSLVDLEGAGLAQIPGEVPPGTSSVRVVFSLPVMLSTLDAVMVSEDGSPLNPNGTLTRLTGQLPAGATTSSNILDLVLPAAQAGSEGNLSFRVATGVGGMEFSRALPVYFGQSAAAVGISEVRQITSNNPDQLLGRGEKLEIILNRPVGGRTADGEAVSAGQFLPVVVSINQTVTRVRTTALLAEPNPGTPYVSGGFTTRLQLTLPPNTPVEGFEPTQSMEFSLQFNDAARRDGGVTQGAQRITTPDGTPLAVVAGTVPVVPLDSEIPDAGVPEEDAGF